MHNKLSGDYLPNAQSILLSFSHPGPYGACVPLIAYLLSDPRCSSLCIIADGYGALKFPTTTIAQCFTTQKIEIQNLRHDIAVITPSNGASLGERLYASGVLKQLGFRKIFYLMDGWGSRIVFKETAVPQRRLGKLDGIFLNDELALEIFKSKHPKIDTSLLHSFGTPVFDHLASNSSDDFKEKLGITNTDTVLTFLGSPYEVSEDFLSVPTDHNVRSWRLFLKASLNFAKRHPDKRIVLILRAHPRDTMECLLLKEVEKLGLQFGEWRKNVKLLNLAEHSGLSAHEVCSLSSVVASVNSTETLLSAFYRPHALGIFLAFGSTGARTIFNHTFPLRQRSVLKTIKKLRVVNTSQQYIKILETLETPRVDTLAQHTCVSEQIADTIIGYRLMNEVS